MASKNPAKKKNSTNKKKCRLRSVEQMPILNAVVGTLTPATKTNTAEANSSLFLDILLATCVNTLAIKGKGAFDAGYVTGGFLGPERGTDQKEIAVLEDDAMSNTKLVPEQELAEKEEADTTAIVPTHVPMTEGEINALNVTGLKEQLKFRLVPFILSLKKADLIAKLRKALDQQQLSYTQEQLDALAVKPGSKKKVDDMKDFAVDAYLGMRS
jgi:hypothetical protein